LKCVTPARKVKKMKKTHRIIKIFGTLITIAAMALTIMALCSANSSVGFSITPILPDNQQNGSSFFDLLVYPGQEQDLTVVVHNESPDDIVVLVEVATASTNRNGDIDYTSKSTEMDETLAVSLEELITIPQTHYTIPAESNLPISVKLKTPDHRFDGIILGSVRVLKEVTEEERAAAGMIVNQYAYVTAVRLAQNGSTSNIAPDFALGDVTAELVNYRASIVAQIRNPKPMIINGAKVTSEILPKGSTDPIFTYDMPDVSFAPNSIFDLSFVDREGYGIEAGDYTAKILVEHAGETWNFEKDFTITAQEAAIVNENAVNQQAQQNPRPLSLISIPGIPQWVVYIGISVLVIMFVGLLILTVIIVRRNMKPICIEDLIER